MSGETWSFSLLADADRRAGPIPCPGGEGKLAPEAWTWESGRSCRDPHLARGGASYGGVNMGKLADWPTQPSSRPWSETLSWSTPTSSPSRSCWRAWRGWPCISIAAGSPMTQSNSRLSVSLFEGTYWHCSRSQSPLTSLRTHRNKYLQVKLFGLIGQKGILNDTPQPPMPPRWTDRWRRCGKDRGVEWYMHRILGLVEDQSLPRGVDENFFFCYCCLFVFVFNMLGRGQQGWRVDMEGLGNEWDSGA